MHFQIHDYLDFLNKQYLWDLLRSMERKGPVESRLFEDGEVRWRITEKGRISDPSIAGE
jgi:hypothetical protein